MKKSPLSTPGGHTGNFHHQNRGRRGFGYHQSRNNSNDHFHRFAKSNNSLDPQFDNEMIPLDSSSPVFYHKRGNKRPMFDRRNQRFSSTGSPSSHDKQRSFQNNSDSPYYQRNPNQFRQKNEPNWHRRLPITEFIDLNIIFDNPWAKLEKDIAQQSNIIDNTSNEIVLGSNELKDTLSGSESEENSTDIDNSREEHKDGSSVDLQLDGINFNCDSKNASM